MTRKLDLSIECDRYILGRAFYHLSQRRGFLSNRKDSTKEQEGEVKAAISELSDKIKRQDVVIFVSISTNCIRLGIKYEGIIRLAMSII